MTIFTNDNKQFATANGVTTTFYFTFRLLQAGDLDVYVDEVLKTLNSDYTVSINTNGVGGSVTFGTAPGNLLQVLIHRVVDETQESALPIEDDFQQVTLENALDKLTMEVQQLQEELDRTPQSSLFDPSHGTLTLTPGNPGDNIGWDGGGNLENHPAIPGPTGPTGATGPVGPTGATGPGITGIMTTQGDLVYGATGGAATRLPGNITTQKKYLAETGDGTHAGTPDWEAIALGGLGTVGAVTNQLIKFNGFLWDHDFANVSELADVDTTGGLTDGYVLTWDAGASKWLPKPKSTGGLKALAVHFSSTDQVAGTESLVTDYNNHVTSVVFDGPVVVSGFDYLQWTVTFDSAILTVFDETNLNMSLLDGQDVGHGIVFIPGSGPGGNPAPFLEQIDASSLRVRTDRNTSISATQTTTWTLMVY